MSVHIILFPDQNQDKNGFHAHLKKLLTATIYKYVKIGKIEWGEITYKGSPEHCKN